MTRKSKIVPIVLVLAVLGLGIFAIGRNTTGRIGTTPQGRNLVGQRMQSTIPYAGTPTTISNITETRQTPNMTSQAPSVRNPRPTGQPSVFDTQKADNIKKQLANVTGISNVNAIVSGNTALVSYKRLGNAINSNATRTTITDRVKNMDSSITNVVVSDTADFSTKVSRLASDIKNNKPVNDMTNQFNRIVQSIKSSLTR